MRLGLLVAIETSSSSPVVMIIGLIFLRLDNTLVGGGATAID